MKLWLLYVTTTLAYSRFFLLLRQKYRIQAPDACLYIWGKSMWGKPAQLRNDQNAPKKPPCFDSDEQTVRTVVEYASLLSVCFWHSQVQVCAAYAEMTNRQLPLSNRNRKCGGSFITPFDEDAVLDSGQVVTCERQSLWFCTQPPLVTASRY